MTQPKIALQMYTVREDLAKDFVGTYRAVAAMGYPGVQPAGYGNLPAQDFRKLLDELHLQVAGTHVNLDALENRLDGEIDYAKTMGTIDLVVPFIAKEQRSNLAGWQKVAQTLNDIGAKCKQRGMRLSYHNHAFEFETLDLGNGKQVFALDYLLGETDPTLVYWEPDVYWILYGGQDPAAYIRKYSGRCPLVHIKDMAATEDRTFAPIGTGVVDFKAIFSAAEDGGAEWYIVEQDRCEGPCMDAARTSLENLRRWEKLA